MGKWDALKDKYPALPEDPSRLEALKIHLDDHRPLDLAALTAAFDLADEDVSAAKDRVSEHQARKDAIELLLIERIENTGMDRATFRGRNYTPTTEPYPIVKDKAALIAYGIDGHPEVLGYQHQTVKTLLKEWLQGEGDALPGVDTFLKKGLSRTKASTK